MEGGPITVTTSYKEVFHRLETAILRGDMPVGSLVPTEAELCETFQLRRSSVREGMRLLEQSGLVQRGAGRRLVVTVPARGGAAATFIHSVALSGVTLSEMWRVQRELDGLAARLACTHIDAAGLEAIARNLDETEKDRSDSKRVVALDMTFHRLIAETSGNRALVLAREPLGQLVLGGSEFVITSLAQSTERMIAAHRKVYEAICARDEERAAEWMMRHWDDFKRGCEMAGANFEAPVVEYMDAETILGMTRNMTS